MAAVTAKIQSSAATLSAAWLKNTYESVKLRNSILIRMSGIIVLGVGLAVVGVAGRYVLKRVPNLTTKMSEAIQKLPKVDPNSKYYKGGFEPTMTKREAYLILGISPSASRLKIKEAHKRIMLLNHPDKGGSPYLASKINEAKDFIEKTK